MCESEVRTVSEYPFYIEILATHYFTKNTSISHKERLLCGILRVKIGFIIFTISDGDALGGLLVGVNICPPKT